MSCSRVFGDPLRLVLGVLATLCTLGPIASVDAAYRRAPGLERFRRGRRIEGPCPQGPCLALTFDDGPESSTTPRILEELARRSVRAAFFVVGHRFAGSSEVAERNREVLREAYRRGHLIGNHTYGHANLDALDAEAIEREMDTTDALILRTIGERTALFRPPYGAFGRNAIQAALARGYTAVLWEIDSRDWAARDAAGVLANLRAALDRSPNGGVVLFHDTLERTVAALPAFFDEVEMRNRARLSRGEAPYRFVSLDEFWRPLDRRAH